MWINEAENGNCPTSFNNSRPCEVIIFNGVSSDSMSQSMQMEDMTAI